MRRNYRISDLKDYINWVYFFHAWSLPQQSEEGQRLYEEAQKMLQRLQPYLKVKTAVEILPAFAFVCSHRERMAVTDRPI